jgi:hypothetical protein
MVSKLKRASKELKKTSASYTSDKGLIARMYWELKNPHFQKKSMNQ